MKKKGYKMAVVNNNMFWETDPEKVLINQVLRSKDIKKNRKKMQKELGKICVKIKPNLWVLRAVFDDYIKATTQNLPAGYGWVTPQDLYEELVMNKIQVMGHIGYTPQFKKKFKI